MHLKTIGARLQGQEVVNPKKKVLHIAGDDSFRMNCNELATVSKTELEEALSKAITSEKVTIIECKIDKNVGVYPP